uniref:Uncharacterized protein n=1 Tax=viral metagenome TaxID=1070528 RepID=A0A6C0KFN3_9ZZZZ
MKFILYYSNFCQHSKKILLFLSRSKLKDDIHFICIDQREKTPNNKVNIILPNGKRVLLPPNVTEVPALLLLHQGNNIIVGGQIMKQFENMNKAIDAKATNNNMEPLAFSLDEMSGMSDTYSYLDMTSEQMTAKGNGGMRMLHDFVSLDHVDLIETPPDDFEPNKAKETDYTQLLNQRK